MMNFTQLNAVFQTQAARAVSFFKGQERQTTESTEARELARYRHDELVISKQMFELNEQLPEAEEADTTDSEEEDH